MVKKVTGNAGKIEEAERKALNYARANWGNFFPGSSIDIYEWVESLEPPELYTGAGTPRSTTDYVQLRRYNPASNKLQFFYYFWVKGRVTVPNLKNRTISTEEAARLIANPRSFAYRWFAPVKATDSQASFIVANSQDILSKETTVLQLNYRAREHAFPEHTQWKLVREDDTFTTITDGMWNKMVDSLVGYSAPLPLQQYPLGVPIENPDVRQSEHVTLPVPNPTLSPSERLGIKVRPQQSMFSDLVEARRAVIFTINQLLAEIKIWVFAPAWTPASTSEHWEEYDWYAEGFDVLTATANRRIDTVQELDVEELRSTFVNGELVQIYPVVPQINDRYEVHQYDKDDDEFSLVRREKGTVRLKESLYSGDILISLRQELREILISLRDVLFINQQSANVNKIYISAVNYAFSEQQNLDWAFKTTYIVLLQEGRTLRPTQVLSAEVQDEFIEYIKEAKPYHTKLRKTITTVKTEIDIAEGNIVEEELLIDIIMVFDRVSEETDPTLSPAQVIDALGFKFDWDNGSFDIGGILVGIDDLGNEVEISGDFRMGWDSLHLKTALGGDENSFGDTTTVHVDGKSYVYPHHTPQEMVPAQASDSVVITVDTDVVDGNDLQYDGENVLITTPVSYTINVLGTGEARYSRNLDATSTTLAQDIDEHAVAINVADSGTFPDPSGEFFAAIWVGAERIEYNYKLGNVLSGIKRATHDTTDMNHTTGDKIFLEDGNQMPVGMDDAEWFSEVSHEITDPPTETAIYLDSAGKLGDFLQNGPGTANS